MGDINAACEAIATAVGNVPDLRAKPYLDDQINPPEAQVFNRGYDPRLVFSGAEQAIQLAVRVFVPRLDLKRSQEKLRDYAEPSGTSSIIAYLEDSTYYSSDVHYVVVTRVGEPFETATGDATYLAVDFDVDVVL